MPAKLYQKEGQPGLGPGLSVARAFGDLNATALGIIAHPCIATVELGPQDEFLVLATDGVWEFLENDVVIEIVKKHHDAGKPAYEACKYIIARAALAWKNNEGDYRDDITVMVAYLPALVEHLKQEICLSKASGTDGGWNSS